MRYVGVLVRLTYLFMFGHHFFSAAFSKREIVSHTIPSTRQKFLRAFRDSISHDVGNGFRQVTQELGERASSLVPGMAVSARALHSLYCYSRLDYVTRRHYK